MNKLSDEFDNEELNHFTHYDYLLQVIINGQFSAFKDHLKEIINKDLIWFIQIMPECPEIYKNAVCSEILKRRNNHE